MASLSRQGPDQPIVGINVTPLVDITLFLLIIFMVTAKLVVSRGLPLDLPQATQGEAVQQVFQVGIDEDGATSANGHAVSDEEALVVRAREALAAHPALRAVISAHRLARHERVMAALACSMWRKIVRRAPTWLPRIRKSSAICGANLRRGTRSWPNLVGAERR